MNCPQVQESLSDFALEETPAAARHEIESHLSACASCAAALGELRETIRLVRESTWGSTPEPLSAARRRRLEEDAAATRRPHSPRSRWLIAASLAATAVGASVLFSLHLMRRDEPLPPVAQTFEAGHGPLAPAAPAAPASQALGMRVQELGKKLKPGGAPEDAASAHLGSGSVAYSGVYRATRDAAARRAMGEGGVGIDQGLEAGAPGGAVGGVVGGLASPCLECSLRAVAPGDMFFEHQGTNRFVETRREALSTFGLDVDTASYTVARNYLLRGMLPPPNAVRVEEFVNAFPPGDVAEPGRTFTLRLEGAPSPFRRGLHLLRIGLKAKEVAVRDRKPAVLTFVIDVSGSMGLGNRLGLVKRSLRLLIEKLDERDRIGIVVYGTNGRVVLEPTPASEAGAIRRVIDRLVPEGSTNLEHGLNLGYDMAAQAFDPGASNRLVLCTDGVANNGVVDPDLLLGQIHRRAEKGVYMTALGFGMGNYNDALLQKLADQGNGQYAYIDDFTEAQSFFLRKLTGILEVVARDAKAQVQFDPGRVEHYRLLGYEKRDVPNESFRDDTVDGGQVNAGHTVTVLYELKLANRIGPLGRVRVRYTDPDTREVAEIDDEIPERVLRRRFEDTSPRFRLAAVVARFAEHLRRSPYVRGSSIQEVVEEAETLPLGLRRSPEVSELVALVRTAARLQRAEDP